MSLHGASKTKARFNKSFIIVVTTVSVASMYGLFVVTDTAFNDRYILNEAPFGKSKEVTIIHKLKTNENLTEDNFREDHRLEKKNTNSGVSNNRTLNQTDSLNEIVKIVVSMAAISSPSLITIIRQNLISSYSSTHESLLAHLKEMNKAKNCSNCSPWESTSRILVDNMIRIHYNETWSGLHLPLICAVEGGRLGNIMGEYASAFALKVDSNSSSIAVTPSMSKTLKKIFPQVSLPAVEINNASDWTHLSPQPAYIPPQMAAVGLLGPGRFLVGGYPCEFQFFNVHRKKILQEFIFSDVLLEKANDFLVAVTNAVRQTSGNESLVFVGVHIRLTDYRSYMAKKHGLRKLDYSDYLERAVKYYKSLYSNVAFVVTSDDVMYALKFFRGLGERNVFFPVVLGFFLHMNKSLTIGGIPQQKRLPEEDMSLLAQCNHSIITLGTFGFWTGYLSPGTTLYPDIKAPRLQLTSRKVYETAKLENFIPIQP